jgi:hypothetical protein
MFYLFITFILILLGNYLNQYRSTYKSITNQKNKLF